MTAARSIASALAKASGPGEGQCDQWRAQPHDRRGIWRRSAFPPLAPRPPASHYPLPPPDPV